MNDYVNPAILTTPMLPPIGGSIVPSWGPPPGSAPPMDAGDAGQPIADRESLDQAGDQLQRFGAAVGGAYQSSLLDGNSNAREMALERAVEERNATVKAATGADLENPMRDGYLGEALYRWRQETGQSFANDQPGLQGVDIGGLSPSEQSRVHALQLQVYQEKIDALERAAGARGITIPPGVLPYLITHFQRDMPSLSGMLNAVINLSLEIKRPITLPFVREVINEHNAPQHAQQ